MFRIIYLGDQYECQDVAAVEKAVELLRDAEIEINDLRPEGKTYNLTVDSSGFVHETYGSRLVVRDVGLLLETPGRPVYT